MISFLLLVVVFLNFFLALFVSAQNKKDLNARLFGLLGFFAGVWAFSNYLTGIYPELRIVELTYATGSLVMTAGFFWVWHFTKDELPSSVYVPLSVLAIFLFFASFAKGFIVESYEEILLGGAFIGESGYGLIFYSIYILVLGIIMVYELFKAHREHQNEKGSQYKYVGIGVLITFGVTALSSLIAPLFSLYFLTGLDSIGFFIFLSIIAYTITRHHLFDSKIIATQIFTVILWAFLVLKIFLSVSTRDLIINAIFFVFSIVFGVLLVRSVINEVESREKIEGLALNLQLANKNLEKANEMKSQFLSIASHQFRSPLTAIKGYTSLILDGTYGKIPKTLEEPMDRIYTSSNNLALIVDDFLNLSRIEQGRMNYDFEEVDMDEFVQEIVDEQCAVVEKKEGLELYYHVDEGVDMDACVDKGKIRQVITNLVDNAIKYTLKGRIDVYLEKVPERGMMRIRVTDTGVGIPRESIGELFGQFKRAKNANDANVMGTGLGLYIAREIVDKHRGRIWAESEGEGKGSTFTVELPIIQG